MSNNEIREKRKKVICDLVKDDFYVPMKEKELAMFLQVAKEDREEFRVSSAIGKENHLYIDTVENSIGEMSVIHIDALVDEMINFIEQEENEELRGQALAKKLGERIVEVLYGI